MQQFSKAILKLTAIYSMILLIVCVGFSVVIYSSATRGFDQRPLNRPPNQILEIHPEIEAMIEERDSAIKQQLLIQLIIINACVIAGGVFLSYYLARLTLRPIDENMKAQTDFVSNASHELRTPLNTMRMENEVIRRDHSATKADYQKLVDSNLEEISTLSDLCTSLLALSRNEKPIMTSLDLQQVTSEAVIKILPHAQKKSIRIINRTQPAHLNANYEMFQEILIILLENAIKYSPSKSKIYIKTAGHKVMISDTGPGITEADLPHIFERFYRAEKSHTTNGHGLGLSIAQHLAQQQNLKITAENNPKHGATFTIY